MGRVNFRDLRGMRLAALLLQLLAFIGLGASILNYSALDSSVRDPEIDPQLHFVVGAISFSLLSFALAIRFPFDLLVRIPAVAIAAVCLWGSGPLLVALPKVFWSPAPLHLILSYLAFPTAFAAAFLVLAYDLVTDVRGWSGRRSHAA